MSITPISGKQREIQERDERFLDAAQEILLESGYHGLTMARVAERTAFSKGTVYNRFACKEDLVAALGRRCRAERLALIERALAFPGRPRERMVAIGEAAEYYAKSHPDGMRVVNIMNAEAVLEKVAPEQRASVMAYDARMFGHMVSVVKEAIAARDLRLPRRSTPEELSFALWALVDGGAMALLTGAPLGDVGVKDAYGAIARGCHILMDGCGWRPLSGEWDYSATSKRIVAAIFADAAAGGADAHRTGRNAAAKRGNKQ